MFHHLLVPLDGSDVSERALPSALAMAAAFGGRLTLLRVVPMPHIIGGHGNDLTEPYAVFLENRHREAETYIREKMNTLRAKGYSVHGLAIRGESVANVVLEMADRLAVDTIVMGTHGRGGLYHWLLGSVADKVLRCAAVPVLLIPTLVATGDNH